MEEVSRVRDSMETQNASAVLRGRAAAFYTTRHLQMGCVLLCAWHTLRANAPMGKCRPDPEKYLVRRGGAVTGPAAAQAVLASLLACCVF